ncbi:MAG TPA: alpha/beta hydrolase, partial [Gaiellaceae bacterium]
SPERWNLETWIQDVVDFCDALELEHPVILGQSFGGVVALGVAIRHPELAGKLIVSSSIGRFRLDRALPMFERLGGAKARDVAERYFHDPNEERLAEFMAMCLPLYNPTPLDADAIARVVMRPEVGFHFFRGEGLRRPHRQSRHGLFWSASQASPSAMTGSTSSTGSAARP